MGFNKLILPEVSELRDYLKKHGNQEFARRWAHLYEKRDAVIGPTDSHDFIKQFLKQTYNASRSDNMDISGTTKA